MPTEVLEIVPAASPITRLTHWITSRTRNPHAVCGECGKKCLKTEMYHDQIYGWFCNREEMAQRWMSVQW